LAKKKAKKVKGRVVTAKEFAEILGVCIDTAREYCLKIQAGDHLLKKLLTQNNGLVSVTRLSRTWSIVVKDLPHKK
jgi:hypothetical protein